MGKWRRATFLLRKRQQPRGGEGEEMPSEGGLSLVLGSILF